MDTDGPKPPQGSRDLGPTLHGVDFVLISLSTLTIACRIFTRVWVTQDIGSDDYTIIVALALVWVGKAMVFVEVVYALGRHKTQVAMSAYQSYLKYDLLDWAQTITVLAVSKIAICLFLLRLTPFHKLRYAIWALIIFIVVSHIPVFFLLIFRCKPVAKYWNEELPGTCHSKKNTEIVIIVQGVISILVDVLCAATPIVLLHNAKIKRRVKVQLCLLMGFGFLTAIACCIRTGFSYQVTVEDLSWASFGIAMARAVEVNMGICAACAPMMKPFTRFIRAKLFNGDTRILHSNHHSNLSFWHGSWWRTNSKDDTPQGQIVLNRNIQSVSEEKARIAGRNNIAQKDFRIPSMSLGTDFQDRVGASSRLDYDTVEELKAEWPLKDRPESDLNEKSWFRNDEESR